MRETWVQSLGQEDPPEKEMATHSSILAWRIPWTEEPGGLQSMGRKELDTTAQLSSHMHACTTLLNLLIKSNNLLEFCGFLDTVEYYIVS